MVVVKPFDYIDKYIIRNVAIWSDHDARSAKNPPAGYPDRHDLAIYHGPCTALVICCCDMFYYNDERIIECGS